jgi:hypothetical protein
MPLADMQHQVNGGPVMGSPGSIRLENVLGLGAGPIDEKRYSIGGAAGYRWGREHRRGNLITFEGQIVTPGAPASAYAIHMALRAAFSPATLHNPGATFPWVSKWPGQAETVVQGRPRTYVPDLGDLALGVVTFVATFECAVAVTV